jgi:hypothetical protein
MSICESGWTSLGDYSLDSAGPKCLINFGAVRILSYFIMIIPSICNILIIWPYIGLAIRNKSYYAISREYKTLFPLCFFIHGTLSVIFGILKISHPNGKQHLIGRDLSVTLTVLFSLTILFSGLIMYLHVIIEFLKGYSLTIRRPSRERVFQRFDQIIYYSWFIIPAVVISCILLLLAIEYPSKSEQLCRAHFIGMSLTSFIYGAIFFHCLTFVLKELKMNIISGNSSNQIKVVAFRLNIARIAMSGTSAVCGTLLLIIGSSKLFFYLGIYLYLIVCTLLPPILYILVVTVNIFSHKKPSSTVSQRPSIIAAYNKEIISLKTSTIETIPYESSMKE